MLNTMLIGLVESAYRVFENELHDKSSRSFFIKVVLLDNIQLHITTS